MLCVRHIGKYPLDYSKCCQTVTVYHKKDPGKYIRTVFRNAFLDFRKNRNIDKTGIRESNSFLLVIPGDGCPVTVNDKVLLGEGPEIESREAWANFIPAKVPGLVIVKYVDPKFWQGKPCHVEAGG